MIAAVTIVVAFAGLLARAGGRRDVATIFDLVLAGAAAAMMVVTAWAWLVWTMLIAAAALIAVLKARAAMVGAGSTDWLLVAAWPAALATFLVADRMRLGDVDTYGDHPGTFDFFLDIGCFQDPSPEQQLAEGRGVTALANPGATLLVLAFQPTRICTATGASSRTEVETAFPGWEMLPVEPANTAGLGWPLTKARAGCAAEPSGPPPWGRIRTATHVPFAPLKRRDRGRLGDAVVGGVPSFGTVVRLKARLGRVRCRVLGSVPLRLHPPSTSRG